MKALRRRGQSLPLRTLDSEHRFIDDLITTATTPATVVIYRLTLTIASASFFRDNPSGAIHFIT